MHIKVIAVLTVLLFTSAGHAETIAVIGTGNVGMALGTEFAAQGHAIIYGSRSPLSLKTLDLNKKTGPGTTAKRPADAAAGADVIVLAVPGMVVEEVVNGLGDVAGKIVIDATNPLLMDEAMHFSYGVETSNGEIVQAALPGAYVVKAFNTISWQQMIDPESANGPLSVPLLGDHVPAKAFVAKLATGMGLEPIDLGPLEYSRWTEFAAVVALNNEFTDRQNFDMHLRKID
jgi:hypothetical protein